MVRTQIIVCFFRTYKRLWLVCIETIKVNPKRGFKLVFVEILNLSFGVN